MKFRTSASIEVRFRDTDAIGHVNNAVYLSYLEMGRAFYWRKIFGMNDFSKVDFVVARAEIDFRSPAYMGEILRVELGVTRIGKGSFDFAYEIRDSKTNRLVAEAKTTQATFDHASKKTRPVPGELRSKILEFEGKANVLLAPLARAAARVISPGGRGVG